MRTEEIEVLEKVVDDDLVENVESVRDQGWHKKPNPVLPTRFNTVLTS